jgi:CBS domain-containing protein
VRISTILRNKGHDVTTIDPDATLQAACDLLAARRIGAALVLDGDGRAVGVLSERDVVRAVAEQGAAALTMTVRERMSSPVQTCDPTDGIDRVMAFMTDHRIRHLPVVEDGVLIGIVSIGDVVKLRVDTLESETRALTEYITTGR